MQGFRVPRTPRLPRKRHPLTPPLPPPAPPSPPPQKTRRYSLRGDKRALTKFLKSVDWGDAYEARQVGLGGRPFGALIGGELVACVGAGGGGGAGFGFGEGRRQCALGGLRLLRGLWLWWGGRGAFVKGVGGGFGPLAFSKGGRVPPPLNPDPPFAVEKTNQPAHHI